MKRIIFTLTAIVLLNVCFAQHLPHYMTEHEKKIMPLYLEQIISKGETTPPSSPVRAAAEWEEMQGMLISWQQFSSVLTQMTAAAVEQGKVFIVTESESYVQSQLTNAGVSLDSVVFLDEPSNSVWIRDYGPNNVYTNNVDSLLFVDWKYNRPRPDDDVIPAAMAELLNLPLYETTVDPYFLEATGGNFMSDGFGTGFSSELILDENSALTTEEINGIMHDFMGIDRYILMETMPYDNIHHIDMHMKLLNEETLLVGQYPEGVADGPQIEENLQYVLNNFNSVYGTPYKVIRIPMPPDADGDYPDTWGDYRTYTNSVIINKLILVPIYSCDTDDDALQIYRDAMPGYTVVGIDCNETIPSLGAIHCISHEIGATDPLLISHQVITRENRSVKGDQVTAYIEHRSGIDQASVIYRFNGEGEFQSIPMEQNVDSTTLWSATIPLDENNDTTVVQYYIKAFANSGKQQVRPITAPDGFWSYGGSGLNGVPIANAGSDQTVDENSTVNLNGSYSFDPEGEEIEFSWYTNASVEFDDSTLSNPSFTAPSVENDSTILIALKVYDGIDWSIPDTVYIHVENVVVVNEIPVANAGNDQSVQEGSQVALDGTESYDPEGEDLTYEWYTNAEVTFSDATSPTPTFTAPTVGQDSSMYVYLKVHDGNAWSTPDSVRIEIENAIGIAENEIQNNWKIYPNPANNVTYIRFFDDAPEMIRVFDANGRMVMQETFDHGHQIFKLNVADLTNGLYMIQAVSHRNIYSKSFIKK